MCMQQGPENGGLLPHRPCDARAAKYDLVDTQRTHFGQDEDAHTCIKDHEDALGLPGTRITRAVVPSAGKALRINLTTLGPRVLPFSELVSLLMEPSVAQQREAFLIEAHFLPCPPQANPKKSSAGPMPPTWSSQQESVICQETLSEPWKQRVLIFGDA